MARKLYKMKFHVYFYSEFYIQLHLSSISGGSISLFFRPDKYWWFITVVLKTAKKISKAFNNKIKELNKQIQYSSNKHMSTYKI